MFGFFGSAATLAIACRSGRYVSAASRLPAIMIF